MISALFTREERIKKTEDLVALVQGQIKTVEGKLKMTQHPRDQETLNLLQGDLTYAQQRLTAVRAWRDFTSQKIRMFLDHALSTTPYRTIICKVCRKGNSQNLALPNCGTCKGTGTIQKEKSNHFAKAAVEKLKHLKKVLCVTELCAKVKAQTSEANDAYKTLLERNMGLVRKFRSENQTGMEQDDAEQGAMMGILDAAIRFNPVKPESYLCTRCKHTAPLPECESCHGKGEVDHEDCESCGGWGIKPLPGGMVCEKCQNPRMMVKTSTADFKTYAYNWAYRNSRARKDTDKRAGASTLGGKSVHSLEAMTDNCEEGTTLNVVQSSEHAALGMVGGQTSVLSGTGHLSMDLKTQIDSIGDAQQKAIINYTLAGQSLGEIAQMLGISKATVSKLRDTAYATLRNRMTGYMEPVKDDSEIDG